MEENQVDIPDGWVEITHLGSLSKVYNGLSGKTKDDFGTGEPYIPYVNVFKNSKIDISELDYVKVRIGERQNIIQYGDIIFTTSSETIKEVGMTSVFLEKSGQYLLNSFCFILRLNNKDWLIPKFSQFLFRSENARYSISLLGQGSTRYNLSKTRLLKELRLLIPSDTSEQTQIANILCKVDEAITQTEQLIAKYTRIKTGLMQDLLTKGIDEHGNIRSEETHEFKDSLLGRIPKEWNVSSVDSLCSEIVVGIVIRPTQYYKESGIPMLRSQNIKVDGVVMKDLVYMSEIDNNKLVKSKLSENDVVSVRTGYPGTTAVISKKIEGCNCIDLVISRPNQSLLNSHFLALFINSELGRKQILNHQSGIAQQHFNVGQMKDLMIVKIAISEQLRILDNISSINIQIADFGSSLSKLQSLKTGLMQDLLSGKVRVNHLIKETVTV